MNMTDNDNAELRAWEQKCHGVSYIELGHMIFTAPSESHRQIAERVANERLRRFERCLLADPEEGA